MNIISKKELYKLYIKDKLSMEKIANILKCHSVSIFYYLKKYRIKTRTKKQAMILHCKQNNTLKILPKCIDCGKTLSRLDAIRCKKHNEKFRVGNRHPNYKDGKRSKTYQNHCIDCGKEIYYDSIRCAKCNRERWKLFPKEHPAYVHGKGHLPYAKGFTKELKNKVKERDNYTCQLCGIKEKSHLKKHNRLLYVHHIDYDKKNNRESNLITVCSKCHSGTNFNRDYWKRYITNKILRKGGINNDKLRCVN
jgi:DNA-directed RNA polymerase subunit RPC12/RpoP